MPLQRLWPGYGFDLDGTLIDTAPDLHRALNHALAQHGHQPVEEAHTRQFIGHGALVMIERALEHHEDASADLDALLDCFLDYYSRNIAAHSRPYPGVEAALEQLAGRGAALALITNKRKAFADQLVQEMGWAGRFEVVIGGDTAAQPKPAADPLLLACEQLELEPENFLYVGDSKTDAGAAKAAGCPLVLVADGYNEGLDPTSLGADAVIDHFMELVPA